MAQTNILIVEDDLTTQEMARMVLENAGYRVSCACSAEDAERMIREQKPELVLMDRNLPGVDGLELTRRLKRAEATAEVTIIAFSSKYTPPDIESALAAGSDGFLHKPFSIPALLQTVSWHIAARRPARPEASNSPKFTMNFARNIVRSMVLLLAVAGTARAQVTQTVNFQVDAINQIAISGAASLTITTAVAGSAPTSVQSTATSWAVTTNQTNAKITASVPTMPTGITLTLTMTAPGTAASAGAKVLGPSAVDMVTGITKLNATGLQLLYQLDATSAAGVVSGSRSVTFTITGGV